MPQLLFNSPMPFASPSLVRTAPSPAAVGGIVPYNTNQQPRSLQSTSQSQSSSVRLSCLSPNGRSIHTFVIRNSIPCIESYRLPLAGTIDEQDENELLAATASNGGFPDVVRTSLPERVSVALDQNPAVELLTLDRDGGGPSTKSHSSKASEITKLPKLCLYTTKDVFVLELGYYSRTGSDGAAANSREVEGVVIDVKEPFDRVLLASMSTRIIRIRQAPQQHMGYAVISPSDCMAMLTLDPSINEYALTLYHGGNNNDMTTTPVAYSTELIEERNERITDFCFCQSKTLPLLSSITVAFLKGSGEVLTANPVVFRGTVVSRNVVADVLSFIDSELKQFQSQNNPRWRQYRGAQQYIMDAFPDDGLAQFVTAQGSSTASEWPVKVQGPVLLAAESDDFETSAMALEPIFAGDLVGLAVGHAGDLVEFGILSPSTLVPRFDLESLQDTYQLDEDTMRGAAVCRVDLRDEEESYHGASLQSAVSLIRDPIMDTVVHYVTPSSIKSISTNALKVISNKIRRGHQQQNPSSQGGGTMFSPPSRRQDAVPRTTAWSCFDASSGQELGNQVIGATVSGDVNLGHTMISLLSSGSLVAINLTEARHFQEMEDNQNRPELSRDLVAGDKALMELQETPPLTEVVQPLIDDIVKGVSNMGKIVGTATPIQSITAADLAAVASVKERCEKEVVLPLMKMKEHVKLRSKELAIMHANQVSQLKVLKESIKKLRERREQMAEKAELVKENAVSLAKRSSSALETSKDLQPTLTQAEYDYFKYLKQLDTKLKEYERNYTSLEVKVSTVIERLEDQGDFKPELPPETGKQLLNVVTGSGFQLRKQKEILKTIESEVDDLKTVVGLDSMSLGQ